MSNITTYHLVYALVPTSMPTFGHFGPLLSKATAGTDMVKKCVAGLVQGTGIQRLALVDAHAYDAFPALATLEASAWSDLSIGVFNLFTPS